MVNSKLTTRSLLIHNIINMREASESIIFSKSKEIVAITIRTFQDELKRYRS